MKIHEKYMNRCIQLGRNALGSAAPNPMVGCVIVSGNRIIGEGFTSAWGGPHAEVAAVRSVRDKSLLAGASLYVSLEPCAHFGKTPPCSDLILKHTIPRVFIGLQDPNPVVGGKGIRQLREAGCKVVTGVLEAQCRDHHRRFLTYHEKKRPYVILKWAQTLDGFLAPPAKKRQEVPEPYWISNRQARQLVHQWRAEEQAILVGTNTVLQDNPRLNARHWKGRSPLRVILDESLRIPVRANVLDKSAPTLVVTAVREADSQVAGIPYEVIDFKAKVAEQLCSLLYDRAILSLMVEGGAKMLQTFIDSGLWDEARIITGNLTFGKGTRAPHISGRSDGFKSLGDNVIKVFRND